MFQSPFLQDNSYCAMFQPPAHGQPPAPQLQHCATLMDTVVKTVPGLPQAVYLLARVKYQSGEFSEIKRTFFPSCSCRRFSFRTQTASLGCCCRWLRQCSGQSSTLPGPVSVSCRRPPADGSDPPAAGQLYSMLPVTGTLSEPQLWGEVV